MFVLYDHKRVEGFLKDLAQDIPKPQKAAFIKCLEHGFAKILKDAPEPERADRKQKLSQKLHKEEGFDLELCEETMGLLAAVLFGEESGKKHLQSPPPSDSSAISSSSTKVIIDNFVSIKGKTFTMGSPVNEPQRKDNETQHQVTLSSFSMGKYPVTQKEYQDIMGTNPSGFKGDNLPVEQVSWYDAINYCNRRSQQEGLSPAYAINGTDVTWNRNANGYRLPTEAEWEYACRAGTTTPFSTGNNITTDQANYHGNYPYNNNARGKFREKTTPKGSFAANSCGLYDMHGNVWEWCWDWYGDLSRDQTDPAGAALGADRVLRGGAWNLDGQYIRSAYRGKSEPSFRFYNIGFRLVRG